MKGMRFHAAIVVVVVWGALATTPLSAGLWGNFTSAVKGAFSGSSSSSATKKTQDSPSKNSTPAKPSGSKSSSIGGLFGGLGSMASSFVKAVGSNDLLKQVSGALIAKGVAKITGNQDVANAAMALTTSAIEAHTDGTGIKGVKSLLFSNPMAQDLIAATTAKVAGAINPNFAPMAYSMAHNAVEKAATDDGHQTDFKTMIKGMVTSGATLAIGKIATKLGGEEVGGMVTTLTTALAQGNTEDAVSLVQDFAVEQGTKLITQKLGSTMGEDATTLARAAMHGMDSFKAAALAMAQSKGMDTVLQAAMQVGGQDLADTVQVLLTAAAQGQDALLDAAKAKALEVGLEKGQAFLENTLGSEFSPEATALIEAGLEGADVLQETMLSMAREKGMDFAKQAATNALGGEQAQILMEDLAVVVDAANNGNLPDVLRQQAEAKAEALLARHETTDLAAFASLAKAAVQDPAVLAAEVEDLTMKYGAKWTEEAAQKVGLQDLAPQITKVAEATEVAKKKNKKKKQQKKQESWQRIPKSRKFANDIAAWQSGSQSGKQAAAVAQSAAQAAGVTQAQLDNAVPDEDAQRDAVLMENNVDVAAMLPVITPQSQGPQAPVSQTPLDFTPLLNQSSSDQDVRQNQNSLQQAGGQSASQPSSGQNNVQAQPQENSQPTGESQITVSGQPQQNQSVQQPAQQSAPETPAEKKADKILGALVKALGSYVQAATEQLLKSSFTGQQLDLRIPVVLDESTGEKVQVGMLYDLGFAGYGAGVEQPFIPVAGTFYPTALTLDGQLTPIDIPLLQSLLPADVFDMIGGMQQLGPRQLCMVKVVQLCSAARAMGDAAQSDFVTLNLSLLFSRLYNSIDQAATNATGNTTYIRDTAGICDNLQNFLQAAVQGISMPISGAVKQYALDHLSGPSQLAERMGDMRWMLGYDARTQFFKNQISPLLTSQLSPTGKALALTGILEHLSDYNKGFLDVDPAEFILDVTDRRLTNLKPVLTNALVRMGMGGFDTIAGGDPIKRIKDFAGNIDSLISFDNVQDLPVMPLPSDIVAGVNDPSVTVGLQGFLDAMWVNLSDKVFNRPFNGDANFIYSDAGYSEQEAFEVLLALLVRSVRDQAYPEAKVPELITSTLPDIYARAGSDSFAMSDSSGDNAVFNRALARLKAVSGILVIPDAFTQTLQKIKDLGQQVRDARTDALLDDSDFGADDLQLEDEGIQDPAAIAVGAS